MHSNHSSHQLQDRLEMSSVMYRLSAIALGATVILAMPLISGPAKAQDDPASMNCYNLWVARNDIYKANGYCFKTSRAIREFGNAGCRFDDANDLPLSRNERRVVAEIARYERIRGCPR
jgi:hypothetical protein